MYHDLFKLSNPLGNELAILGRVGLLETEYMKIKAYGTPIDILDLLYKRDDEAVFSLDDSFWKRIRK